MKYNSASSSTNDYRGQYDTSYYQPQPSTDYNQHQQYCNPTTTQRAPYIPDYDKEKVDELGVTQSGITSSDIKQ